MAKKVKKNRDVEKNYSRKQILQKLKRLAEALEKDENFRIQIAGERVCVPKDATVNIEHERESGNEEIEFQIKWTRK